MKVTYPHYQYLLSDYIARCSGEDILYEKEKIWYLLYQLTEAASIFHSRGEKVGDIRPRNIFLNNFERIKVGNTLSWPHETTNYAKAIY
jgi:serine/threonine protein kinase